MSKGVNVDDLLNNESVASKMPPLAVQALINTTNPEDLQEYQKTTVEYGGTEGVSIEGATSTVMSNASYKDPIENVIDSACQIRLMLRDGLPVDRLTEDEKRVFIYIYGENELVKF